MTLVSIAVCCGCRLMLRKQTVTSPQQLDTFGVQPILFCSLACPHLPPALSQQHLLHLQKLVDCTSWKSATKVTIHMLWIVTQVGAQQGCTGLCLHFKCVSACRRPLNAKVHGELMHNALEKPTAGVGC